jgi:cytochrome c biogenesis protein CcdA
MIDAPLALAFAAGLVATVNPCGFAMLPAYLSYFMGLEEGQTSRRDAMRSALAVGAVVSTGFLVVFGLAGILITAGFRFVIDAIPWVAVVVGVGVVGLGIALLMGREVTIGLPRAHRAASGRRYRSVFLFGVSYAVASLSCTLPVFLTVVATQVTRGSFASGVATFLAYGSGMALVLMAITVALAAGKRSLVARLRGAGRHIGRLSGVVLVATGSYIVWFWIVSIRAGSQALATSGPFRFVEGLSQTLQNAVARGPLLWGLGMAGVIGVGIVVAMYASRDQAQSAPMVDSRDG